MNPRLSHNKQETKTMNTNAMLKPNFHFTSHSTTQSFVMFNFQLLIMLFHLSRVSSAPPFHHTKTKLV
jgi:hypothetical protein